MMRRDNDRGCATPTRDRTQDIRDAILIEQKKTMAMPRERFRPALTAHSAWRWSCHSLAGADAMTSTAALASPMASSDTRRCVDAAVCAIVRADCPREPYLLAELGRSIWHRGGAGGAAARRPRRGGSRSLPSLHCHAHAPWSSLLLTSRTVNLKNT
eukprot:SAG31_NODE_42_length_31262_cov_46.416231_24_plen_157_part_00